MAFSLEAFRIKNLVHNSFDIWYIHGNVATTHENEAAVYKKKFENHLSAKKISCLVFFKKC